MPLKCSGNIRFCLKNRGRTSNRAGVVFYKIDPKYVSQDEVPVFKHWYRDAERVCDLFIWQDDDKKIKRFQFLYRDHILEWADRKGIYTGQLDRYPGVFSSYQSPTYKLHTKLDKRILHDIKQLLTEACAANTTDDLLKIVYGLLTA